MNASLWNTEIHADGDVATSRWRSRVAEPSWPPLDCFWPLILIWERNALTGWGSKVYLRWSHHARRSDFVYIKLDYFWLGKTKLIETHWLYGRKCRKANGIKTLSNTFPYAITFIMYMSMRKCVWIYNSYRLCQHGCTWAASEALIIIIVCRSPCLCPPKPGVPRVDLFIVIIIGYVNVDGLRVYMERRLLWLIIICGYNLGLQLATHCCHNVVNVCQHISPGWGES